MHVARHPYAQHFYRENQREALGLIRKDSAIRRVSKPSHVSTIFVATAASLAAMTDAKQPRRLHAQIPHSTLRLVPGVGHMLHYAVPEEVAEAIEEGLATTLDKTRRASYTASAA